jgi:hypothetical protein
MGIVWCIGCPGAGKTTLAKSIAAQRARQLNRKLVVVDAEGDAGFRSLPMASNVGELPKLLAAHNAVSFDAMSCGKQELRRLPTFLERAGKLVVLIDGAHAVLDAHSSAGDAWVRLQRVHRHAELELVWTTHHLGGDVPQVVQACAPELYVFRTTSPSALKTLEKEFGLEMSRVRTLERGVYIKVEMGFRPTP